MTLRPRESANGRGASASSATPTSPSTDFDPVDALDDLLSDVSLSRTETGGSVAFAGEDPILPAAHRSPR